MDVRNLRLDGDAGQIGNDNCKSECVEGTQKLLDLVFPRGLGAADFSTTSPLQTENDFLPSEHFYSQFPEHLLVCLLLTN